MHRPKHAAFIVFTTTLRIVLTVIVSLSRSGRSRYRGDQAWHSNPVLAAEEPIGAADNLDQPRPDR